jgi:hypothetical protein
VLHAYLCIYTVSCITVLYNYWIYDIHVKCGEAGRDRQTDRPTDVSRQTDHDIITDRQLHAHHTSLEMGCLLYMALNKVS